MADPIRYRIGQAVIDGPPFPVGDQVELRVFATVQEWGLPEDPSDAPVLALRIDDWAGPQAQARPPEN